MCPSVIRYFSALLQLLPTSRSADRTGDHQPRHSHLDHTLTGATALLPFQCGDSTCMCPQLALLCTSWSTNKLNMSEYKHRLQERRDSAHTRGQQECSSSVRPTVVKATSFTTSSFSRCLTGTNSEPFTLDKVFPITPDTFMSSTKCIRTILSTL